MNDIHEQNNQPIDPSPESEVMHLEENISENVSEATPDETSEGVSETIENLINNIKSELVKVFIGQEEVVEQVLVGFLTGGHLLLEGKPGLGKTHLVNSLAQTFGGEFSRIQFTPDLMPSDVTGFTLFDMKTQTFQVKKGPVFTNLLLADEINRAPAKTQAALLEVMQESQVTIDGTTYPLTAPFLTLATQNPIEQEGTYPLPEAQLDRFIMKIIIDYPAANDEALIAKKATSSKALSPDQIERICTAEDIVEVQNLVKEIECVDEVIIYAVNLVRATRAAQGISLGAGTRGVISLINAAKAHAVMHGRSYAIPDDIKWAAYPVLRHRIQLAPELAISGHSIEDALKVVISSVEAPRM